MAINLFSTSGILDRGNEAFKQGYDQMGAMRTDRTNMQAGRAYAGGDRQGAARMLAQGGNIDGARTLENDIQGDERQLMQDQQAAEQTRYTRGREAQADQAKMGEMLMKALDQLPEVSTPDERRQALSHPIWGMFGITPDAVSQLGDQDLTDEAAAAFKQKVRAQIINRGNGAYDVRNMDDGSLIESVEGNPEYKSVAPGATLTVGGKPIYTAPKTYAPARSGAGARGGGGGLSGVSTQELIAALRGAR
jgi:hypothetical protein